MIFTSACHKGIWGVNCGESILCVIGSIDPHRECYTEGTGAYEEEILPWEFASVGGVLGRDHTELTKQKPKGNSVFGEKSATILYHLWKFLQLFLCFPQLYRVGKDQMFFVLLQVSVCHSLPTDSSQRSVDLSQCAEDMDLSTRTWRTEETCKLIFFIYSILTSVQNASYFLILVIFLMRWI